MSRCLSVSVSVSVSFSNCDTRLNAISQQVVGLSSSSSRRWVQRSSYFSPKNKLFAIDLGGKTTFQPFFLLFVSTHLNGVLVVFVWVGAGACGSAC